MIHMIHIHLQYIFSNIWDQMNAIKKECTVRRASPWQRWIFLWEENCKQFNKVNRNITVSAVNPLLHLLLKSKDKLNVSIYFKKNHCPFYFRYYIYFTPFHSTEIAINTPEVLGASPHSSAVLNLLLLWVEVKGQKAIPMMLLHILNS